MKKTAVLLSFLLLALTAAPLTASAHGGHSQNPGSANSTGAHYSSCPSYASCQGECSIHSDSSQYRGRGHH